MSENNGHKAGLRPAHGSYHIAYAEVGTSVAAGCDPAKAALIADAHTSLPRALDALDAVWALHPRDAGTSRPVGWHHFVASPYGVVCQYCGVKP